LNALCIQGPYTDGSDRRWPRAICGFAKGAVKISQSEGKSIMTPSATATLLSELKNKLEAREAHVAIIGMGYVGLPLALLYSEQKFAVTGFDYRHAQGVHAHRGWLLYF
jgi:5,10-methylene-tetrahydrofolate dehydrogenase/methenyl tetrahydrofolate cyclohydrolase